VNQHTDPAAACARAKQAPPRPAHTV
jgi:hypothetical protein